MVTKWLTLKCTLPKVVRWKPSTIIWLEKTKKAHIDVFKLHALDDGHHFDFQGQGTSLKFFFVIMTSNVGSTTSAKSGSGDPQFFINGIQKTIWETYKYKYCFNNSPFK